jgi:hypothetical protein
MRLHGTLLEFIEGLAMLAMVSTFAVLEVRQQAEQEQEQIKAQNVEWNLKHQQERARESIDEKFFGL